MIGPILSGRDVVGETRPGRIQITGQIKPDSRGKETGAGGGGGGGDENGHEKSAGGHFLDTWI